MLTFIKVAERGVTLAKNVQLSCQHHWKSASVGKIIHQIARRQPHAV